LAVEILQSFGDKLIDILFHDCTGGHDVVKILALVCINLLLDIDNMTQFIHFVSSRGYLAHIIDSLLYENKSKMAMLSRYAGSYIGAELLLEHRVIGILSQIKVFGLNPDFQVASFSSENSFIPPIDARYQHILFPALNLCDVILFTLGPENQSVITQITQITQILLSHADIIEIVLRPETPTMNLGLLQKLSAITASRRRSEHQRHDRPRWKSRRRRTSLSAAETHDGT
jgi:nuclear pore complex protein Nup205